MFSAEEARVLNRLMLGGSTAAPAAATAGGRPQLFRAFRLLDTTEPRGTSDVNRALQRYGAAARGPGLAVVLSDFFSPAPPFDGLQYLQHRGLAPLLVQVVAREEVDPAI